MNSKKQIFLEAKKTSLSKIPKTPGVYVFWQTKTKPLYVGKAINLHSRLISYFSKNLFPKTEKMVKESSFVSYITVFSELEALLLEALLVKKYNTRYNTLLKDDKHPLYIKITRDKYPLVLTARKIEEGRLYRSFFGPFPSSSHVKIVLKLLRRIFPYSTHRVTKKACLESQIGLCEPCPSITEQLTDPKLKQIERQKYLENVLAIEKILSGKINGVKKMLITKMNRLSHEENFEEALETKRKLASLEYITQPIHKPANYLLNPNFEEDIRDVQLIQFQKILRRFFKVTSLKRIECFDVSHHAGRETSASMVVFINAKEEYTLYRHFRIVSSRKSNDIASLEETIKRRIKHFDDWGKPNLVIVDGGRGQVKIFYQLLKEFDISVVGLEKRYETLVIPTLKEGAVMFKKIILPPCEARNLIQRIRNEAHRFAIRYHHKLVRKALQI